MFLPQFALLCPPPLNVDICFLVASNLSSSLSSVLAYSCPPILHISANRHSRSCSPRAFYIRGPLGLVFFGLLGSISTLPCRPDTAYFRDQAFTFLLSPRILHSRPTWFSVLRPARFDQQSAHQDDCVPRWTPIPGTKSAHQGDCVPRWTPIPGAKSAHHVACGRPVGLGSVGPLDSGRPGALGSVRRLDWIHSLTFRVLRARAGRSWPPRSFRVRPLSRLDP